MALLSVLRGSALPEKICLYADALSVEKLKKRGIITKLESEGLLQIRAVQDVRAYTKLVYALENHPDKQIVVCDDDVAYPKYWLEDLLRKRSEVGNHTIVCHRAHRTVRDEEGDLVSYTDWKWETCEPETPTRDIFPTGTGGVLYPASCMPPSTTDRTLFTRISPSNDDIWFWYCARENGCDFVTVDRPYNRKRFPDVPGSQASNLFSENVIGRANDGQITACEDYFQSIKVAKESECRMT
ncbi:hypothetical protein [Stieleria maiorica]|uniref:hypothetical protein n=1 Tax=Stieleria maiorica TaxID=2795974 RepID=UPI0011CCBBE4|nr:hypothetical protein [Stieleria maiorica]